ncbi:hypothetical protein EGW08_009634 [Elysia chlorotica]|uniref:AMOP domain-containing protein n=1 Tax=Elysia chlorotica TaxID=188477 RepID=A0A433TM71_ELYCH|nr:hypothetical protein EGW08_009634 [Elysia chlorotica]
MASFVKLAGTKMLYVWLLCCLTDVQGALKAPDMANPPLLNFGVDHGDQEVKELNKAEWVDLPRNISYMGSKYKELYISADGLISFEDVLEYHKSYNWKEGVRSESSDIAFLAPFYFDGFKGIGLAKTKYKDRIYYRIMEEGNIHKDASSYNEQVETLKWLGQYVEETTLNARGFKADLAVVVTWREISSDSADQANVRACVTDASRCETASFQAVLVSDKSTGRTVAILNYLDMKIPMEDNYQAGFNGGYGRNWYSVIPCDGVCGGNKYSYVDSLHSLRGSDLVGRFILDVGGETVIRGGCIPEEITSGILEVFPREVNMFGGEKLEVSGKCSQRSSKIFCRFGSSEDSPVVEGTMYNEMKGFCPVPLMTTKGNILLGWSTERKPTQWTTERKISVLHPSRAPKSVTVPQDVKDPWFSRDASKITVVWDAKKFTDTDANVDISLIGYKETADTVSFKYKTLRKIGQASARRGSFTFNVADHRCTFNCLEFEQGLLEVSLPLQYLSVANERVSVRHGPIPLGWYVNEKMTADNGTDWSDKMCRAWHEEDGKTTDWLSALLPCPCTLDQALADFGRFQPDAGCNLFAGSKCTYHKAAKHCVRAVVPTPGDGAGNQCCYSESGQLVYSQLSYQGSTPDRSHDWGAHPYGGPNLVPSLSHWKHDVVTFYYCCLWNEYKLCDLYMERRPTQDCKNYQVPAVAPVLTAVALNYKSTLVGISLAPEIADPPRGLDIQVKREPRFFISDSTMWQDFDGERLFYLSIVNNVLPGETNLHNNFTILLNNNVGVNVFEKNGLLHITVALPPEMKKPSNERAGMGLLGTYDGSSGNDCMTKEGNIYMPGTDKFYDDFVYKWSVEEERNSAFPFFEAATDLDTNYVFSRYDKIPSNFPEAPDDSDIADVCQDDRNCMWDYRITGSPAVAKTTKAADQLFSYVKGSLKQVENCGLPEVGRNAIMDNYDFSVGSEITVTGCGKRMSFSGSKKYS